jgi:hypothetical protein
MEYKIIEMCTSDDLEIAVNENIAQGWEPLGGVSVSLSESDDYRYEVIAQAMIKR